MARTSHLPLAVLLAFAATWSVQLLTFSFAQSVRSNAEAINIIRSTFWPYTLAKLPRDYGFAVALLGAWLAFSPSTLYIPVLAYLVLNTALLGAHLCYDAHHSIHSPRLNTPQASRADALVTGEASK